MTVGRLDWDDRIWATTGCGGANASWFGSNGYKSWNGGDRVPGEDPSTPHNYTMTRQVNRSFPYTFYYALDYPPTPRQGMWNTCGMYPNLPALTWSAEDEYKLLGKLKRKVQGGSFNLAVFLGEGHQSLAMIANAATRIAQGLTRVKRGDVVGAAKLLFTTNKQVRRALRGTSSKKDAAGNWLALQYGWLPLLGDTEEAAMMLSARLSVPAKQSFRVTRKIGKDGSLYAGSPTDHTWRWAENWRRIKKQVIYEATEDWGGMTIPQILGLLDPEILAWELLPFSFVADWFLPIGDWLEARAFAQKIKGRFVVSTKQEWKWKGIYTGKGVQYAIIQGPGAALCGQEGATFTRAVSTSYADVPRPEVQGFGEAYSWRRAANAIALLVGLHGSR